MSSAELTRISGVDRDVGWACRRVGFHVCPHFLQLFFEVPGHVLVDCTTISGLKQATTSMQEHACSLTISEHV